MKENLFESYLHEDLERQTIIDVVINLYEGTITNDVLIKFIDYINSLSASEINSLTIEKCQSVLVELGVSDTDYDVFKRVVACEGYDFSKTIKRLEQKIQNAQTQQNTNNKK